MTPADNTPDFDSMSPEEIMAWMESLARRQGANAEELTTSADVDIPEVDPDSVVIDEPGYVPYGEERPSTPPRPPAPPPAPETKSPLPGVTQPPPRPQAPPPRPAAPPVWQSIPPRPSAPPRMPFQPQQRPAEPIKPPPMPEPSARNDDDAMSWLESLAADQSDLLFNLDLNALTDEIERRSPDKATEPTNPMAWLENLAGEDDSLDLSALTAGEPAPAAEEAATDTVTDPFASGVDPMAWLENLARRQGAKSEELTTSTAMNIPVPENVVVDEPGYTPFSFDSPIEPRRPAPAEPLQLDDPTEWLDSLAEAQGFDEELVLGYDQPAAEAESAGAGSDDEAIEQALASGTVSPEQMQAFLERQTDLYVQSLEEEALLGDDEPPVPAELPDWLLEQVGPPPEGGWPVSDTGPVLTETIVEPPPAAAFPDWLEEDFPTEGELDLASIFADADDVYEESPSGAGFQIEIDPSDPWVEAFDLEREQGEADLDVIPEWYERNLGDPERIAAVEQLVEASQDDVLADAALPPESALAPGEAIDVPDWLMTLPEDDYEGVFEVETFADEPEAIDADVPDWLRELQTDVETEAIPEWLVESLDETALEAEPEPTAVESQWEPLPESPPAPQVTFMPTPPPAESLETLEVARARAGAGDLDESLLAYEALIRGNMALEPVVADLQSLARQHRDQPAVYRVLGDGLMRQGKLQAALDTYREALNHL